MVAFSLYFTKKDFSNTLLDEIDRMFASPFRNDFFSMLRYWYNEAGYDNNFSKLSLFLGGKNRVSTFSTDFNLSPFNIAKVVTVDGFTLAEMNSLNELYSRPLGERQIIELRELLGGHPFLTQLSFHLIKTQNIDFATLIKTATYQNGPFAEHLARLDHLISNSVSLQKAIVHVLEGRQLSQMTEYEDLYANGLIKAMQGQVVMWNHLYEQYFSERFKT